jgi:hypothetical protein
VASRRRKAVAKKDIALISSQHQGARERQKDAVTDAKPGQYSIKRQAVDFERHYFEIDRKQVFWWSELG